MKKNIVVSLLLILVLAPWACRPYLPISPNPITPTPTPVPIIPTITPTPNQTPVCGMTPVTVTLGNLSLADSGVQVIQNAAQWKTFSTAAGPFVYLTPTPTPPPPPVNFANQMIITAGVPQPCDNTSVTITNVCEGPSQVLIYVTYTTCASCVMCEMASEYTELGSIVAVPQSSLPVSVVTTNISY